MNKIYTLAEFSTQSFDWNSVENLKRITSILEADKDFSETTQKYLSLQEELEIFKPSLGESLIREAKKPDTAPALDITRIKLEQADKFYKTKIMKKSAQLDSDIESIWSSLLPLEEKNKKITDRIKDTQNFFKDSLDEFLTELKYIKNVVDGNVPKNPFFDDLIVVHPPTVASKSASGGGGFVAKAASGGGGGKGGALIAGLAGAGLLAAGLGVGIPLALRSRRKRKERKHIDKGRVKSHVRRGKLVKSHSRNYKPDK